MRGSDFEFAAVHLIQPTVEDDHLYRYLFSNDYYNSINYDDHNNHVNDNEHNDIKYDIEISPSS